MWIYFLLFIIYSFIGWTLEVLMALVTQKKFVNRGFLMGPICPVYGCGGVIITLLLTRYADDLLILFAMSIVICSVLEYFTSWLMEKIFKMRWWDYSNFKFNINGRICLETMLPFGIISLVIIKYLNPFLLSIIYKLNDTTIMIIALSLLVIFIIDLTISSNIVLNLKKYVKDSKKDSTEDIKKYVKDNVKINITSDKLLYRRFINAFPNLKKYFKLPTRKRKS